MYIREIKPIGKFGRNILKDNNAENIIDNIVEKPLQKACKQCLNKNIETVMSSANKNNIMKDSNSLVTKQRILELLQKNRLTSSDNVGKGYAWIMINYNTLSDKNRNILFSLEEELGEDLIWFVKENYSDAKNYIRRKLGIKEVPQVFDDTYSDVFKKKQIKLVYKNNYPTRNVFIRMPVNKETTVEDVEIFFDDIISKLEAQ